MGFSFRRSYGFGPFRLNFSKSGIGASVGVKGAKVTLSPKGKAYITFSAGGFSYRQTLSSRTKGPSPTAHFQPVTVSEGDPSDQIKTADVEELRESSKGELVEDLNRRAKIFNPAIILFVFAGISAFVSIVEMASSTSTKLPTLPDVSSLSDSSRQENNTDEYALLLARYGQPSTVEAAKADVTPLRLATWEGAHLTISFVPVGCVEAYAYFQARRNNPTFLKGIRPKRGRTHMADPASPSCIMPASKASTIVAYEDSISHITLDAKTADQYLSGLATKSSVPPTLKTAKPTQAKFNRQKPSSFANIDYDGSTFQVEQQRLREVSISETKNRKSGSGILFAALLFLIPGIIVHRKNKERRTTQLIYALSDSAQLQLQKMEDALGNLAKSQVIWKLDSQSAVQDWKRNAGAAYNVKRKQVSIRRSAPPLVESNILPLCFDLGSFKLFFLPDQILYWQRGMFASVEYSDLKLDASSTRFIEESVQSSDSKHVGSTWRYVRKDGGPDRRFNNNRELPVMLYGEVYISSSDGLNLVLHTSNIESAGSFVATFQIFQNERAHSIAAALPSGSQKTSNKQPYEGPSCPADIVQAMSVLGVKPGITLEEVTVAYRHMAQMYHPDKTNGLGPELQQLADERMKEINSAHQKVKRYLEHA